MTRVHLVQHRIWKPQPGSPVDLRDVADYLRWLCKGFKVKQILADPSQALQLVAELKAEGLPIEAYPQTVQHVTEMGSAIFTTIQARTLRVYPDAELRQQALNTIAVESTRGWKIDKAKAGNKIDAIVALSMAVRAALEAPQGFEPLSWHDTKSWTGQLEQTAAAHAPELHPHERLEPEGPPKRSERKAAAWRGEVPVPKPLAPILEVDGRPVTELRDGMVSFYCKGSSSFKGCGVRATCRRGELEGVWRRHLRDQHAPETLRRSSARDAVSVIRTGYGPFGSP